MNSLLTTHLQFHDAGLTLRADAPWLLEAAEPILGSMTTVDAPTGDRWAQLTVGARAVEPYIPAELRHRIEIRFRHFSTTCYTHERDLWLMDDGAVIHLPEDSREGVGWVREASAANPSGYQGALIVAAIELFRHLGLYQLHAGCVTRDDRCVLFCGGQAHGKSTATIAMARAGWRCVTDDLLYLREAEGGVGGQGWREQFNVGERTRKAFGLDYQLRGARNDGRYSMDPSCFSFADDSEPVRPTDLIFTQIVDSEQSTLEPAARPEALARMIQHSPMVLVAGRHATEHLELLRGLVLQCNCYLLSAGRDVFAGGLPALVESRLA